MAQLKLCFLGPFQAWLNDQRITGFESNRVRALLAFLVVESDRPHSREFLAGLLWPDWTERDARSNLRYALSNLRQAIGDRQASPPFLLISRSVIQFNLVSDHTLDVATFMDLTTDSSLVQLERAVTLYQGELLTGFSLGDSAPFEEWALLKREQLSRHMMRVLDHLVLSCEGRGDHERAQAHAWRLVELEPLYEQGHQHLMRVLARGGQRGAALMQYETCRRVLAEELGVEPMAETEALHECIRDGRFDSPTVHADQALDLYAKPMRVPEHVTHKTARIVFVSRDRELAQLRGYLDGALIGDGHVIFVTGGPGRGKTALIREFALRAMVDRRELLVLLGGCNAFSGTGDPYLPFREMMDMLTGEAMAYRAGGVLSHQHAERLRVAFPLVVNLLLDHGPHLFHTLLNGPALLSHALTMYQDAPWSVRLREAVTRQQAASGGLIQSQIFHQFCSTLCALAAARPLLLLLDDLQWADVASIDLLFHLGRALANAKNRILIICAYRPEEVALDRPDGRKGRHPLRKVLTEFRRRSGDVWLDLTRANETEGRDFVDALLDTEPNRLGEDFRQNLFQHTGGHPLFTIELLRALQMRAGLVQDAQGHWIEGSAPNWEKLPTKVEAVIEERVDRLDEKAREILATASVEGERFTAQVIAQVHQLPEREVLRTLSHELEKRHRLVREVGEVATEGRFVSHYQFAHALFQSYLYHGLGAGERRVLHGEVANALVRLYGDQTDGIVAQLAHHYSAAGRSDSATEYSLRAGDKARLAYANEEARAHYQRVLKLLQAPDCSAADNARERRFAALLGLSQVCLATGEVAEAERCAAEAVELGRALRVESRELVRCLFWLGDALWWLNRYDEMIRCAQEGLALLAEDAVFSESSIAARGVESAEGVLMLSHLAIANWWTGDMETPGALYPRIAQILSRLPYAPEFRASFSQLVEWYATGVRDIDASSRWLGIYREKATEHHDLHASKEAHWFAGRNVYSMGDLCQALESTQFALELSNRLGDGKFIAESHALAAGIHVMLGDFRQAESHVESGLDIGRAVGRQDDLAWLYWCSGMLSCGRRSWKMAAEALQKAGEHFAASKQHVMAAMAMNSLAHVYLAQGDLDQALARYTEALTLVGPVAWRSGYLPPASPLAGIENVHDDPAVFRAFVRRFREDHPDAVQTGFQNWYLEETEPAIVSQNLINEAFSEGLPGGWVWGDPLGSCSFAAGSGIEIYAANGSDLWQVNQNAPRMLRPAPLQENWVVQTVCEAASQDKPAIGGLLLWQGRTNYLWLSTGRWGEGEICFGGCLENHDLIIGRGSLSGMQRAMGKNRDRAYLRIEWGKGWVKALCSVDGESWFSVGTAEISEIADLQVGLHAIGHIDRSIYHGAYPGGTAIRFRSFQLRFF